MKMAETAKAESTRTDISSHNCLLERKRGEAGETETTSTETSISRTVEINTRKPDAPSCNEHAPAAASSVAGEESEARERIAQNHRLVDKKAQMAAELDSSDDEEKEEKETGQRHRLVETKSLMARSSADDNDQRSVRFDSQTKFDEEAPPTIVNTHDRNMSSPQELEETENARNAFKETTGAELSHKWAPASVRGDLLADGEEAVSASAVAIFVTEPVAHAVEVDNGDERQETIDEDNDHSRKKKNSTRRMIVLLAVLLGAIGSIILASLCTKGKCGNQEVHTSAGDIALIVNATCGDGDRGNGVCSIPTDCCSEFGYCGNTAEHCIPPVVEFILNATCGNGARGNGVCPNPNDCCSDFGWCGDTAEHCFSSDEACGDGTVGDGTCFDETHCCSPRGWCGGGPEYCFSTCGEGYVGDGVCANEGKCCSVFGWCVAPELCVNKAV